MGILQLGTVRLSVDGSKFKANASKLKNRVHKIVDEADKTDAKENTEQGKANDYINHPAEDSEQDSPESQANKIGSTPYCVALVINCFFDSSFSIIGDLRFFLFLIFLTYHQL